MRKMLFRTSEEQLASVIGHAAYRGYATGCPPSHMMSAKSCQQTVEQTPCTFPRSRTTSCFRSWLYSDTQVRLMWRVIINYWRRYHVFHLCVLQTVNN